MRALIASSFFIGGVTFTIMSLQFLYEVTQF